MQKFIRVNKRTFPLLSNRGIWNFDIHPHVYHIDSKTEIELMRYCTENVSEDAFKAKIDSLPLSTSPKCRGQNRTKPKSFKKHFLITHGLGEELPPPTSFITLAGLFMFSSGFLFFLYWLFMVCMGWKEISWPIATMTITVIGGICSGRRLLKYAGDASVSTGGIIDIWLIVFLLAIASVLADIANRDVSHELFSTTGYFADIASSFGGIICIVGSVIFFIPTLLWAIYNGIQFYKGLNGVISRKR